MVRVEIWEEEKYPFYSINQIDGLNSISIEIDQELYDRVIKCEKELDEVQEILMDIYEQTIHNRRHGNT